MTTVPEILFLKQEDAIKAGLLDMKMVMEQTEKAYEYMGKGQVLNPPKVKLGIPDNDNWDSFFMNMPAYIGADRNIAGFKWAAESKSNPAENNGVPYGVDVVILSDPHTVLPVAILDGTIITAMRTSAVAGMSAKHLARKDSKVAALVGAGVIGRTMVMAMMEALPGLTEIRMVDLDLEKGKALCEEFSGQYNVVPYQNTQEACLHADVVVTETTARAPFLKLEWLKKNATVIQMSSFEIEPEVAFKADRLYVDNWAQVSSRGGGLIHHLCEAHGLTREGVIELKEVIVGEKPGRKTDDEFIVCCTLGIGTVDITVAHKLYETAKEKGIGQKLRLWDNPLWV